MIKLSPEIKKELITLSETKNLFLEGNIVKVIDSDGDDNFKEYVYNHLGESISNKFIIPYNEKLYSCDLNSLDYDCMSRFFPKVTFNNVISGMKNKSFKSYNDNFIYPKEGAFAFIKSILKDIPYNIK